MMNQANGIMKDDCQVPLVTVILPVRNEADFIGRCLQSLQASDYPPDRLEFLVVDGQSTDGTADIVRELARSDPRICLLENPHRIVPQAMNLGIRMARGDIIVRVDGHAEVAPDFISNSVAELQAHPDCWCVGGPIETISTTLTGRVIGAAMSTAVGVGNARFRLGDYCGYVDTVAFGAYWRWVFDRIGMFDEELVRNQDDELNARLIQRGGRIWMSPRIRSRYYSRSSIAKLWRQYYQYGFWRIRTIQKLGRPATLRQLAPLLFVLGILVLVVATIAWRPAGWLLVVYLGLYALGLAIGSLQVARRVGFGGLVLAPVVFAVLHVGYGLGSLHGVVWFFFLQRGSPVPPEKHALSR